MARVADAQFEQCVEQRIGNPCLTFTVCLPRSAAHPPRRYRRADHAQDMADFLVVVGIVAFVAGMLALIWALERV